MRNRVFKSRRAAGAMLAVMTAGVLSLAATAPAASADLDYGRPRTEIYSPPPVYEPGAPPLYQAPGYPPPPDSVPYDDRDAAVPAPPYGSYPDEGGDRYQYGYRTGPDDDAGYGVPYDGDPDVYGDGMPQPPRPPAMIAQPRGWSGDPAYDGTVPWTRW